MSMTRNALVLSLVAATGCLAMMKPGAGGGGRTVDNPLVSGSPLEVTKNGDVGVVSEQDCNIWPFEDKLEVKVTDKQICISQHKNMEAPPGWSGEPTSDRTKGFNVANNAAEGGYISTEKNHASKVGHCFNKGYNEEIAIWAFDYQGCAPNNGTVTANTTSLTVGDESWNFPGPAAPAAPNTASGSTLTPNT
ncbi:MAG TPA: hypothetical protein VGM90_37985 [Kofleriaceae bacterium]|jgi:hypothetical protein